MGFLRGLNGIDIRLVGETWLAEPLIIDLETIWIGLA